MSSNTARTTQSIAVLKGLSLGDARIQGEGRVSAAHLSDINGFLLIIGDDVALTTAPHLIQEALEGSVESLGEGQHRLTLQLARVGIMLSDAELAQLRSQIPASGKTLDAPFQATAGTAEWNAAAPTKATGKGAKTGAAKTGTTKGAAGKTGAKTGATAEAGSEATQAAKAAGKQPKATAAKAAKAGKGAAQAAETAQDATTAAAGKGDGGTKGLKAAGRTRGKAPSATANARTPANDAGTPARGRRNAARSSRQDERIDMPSLFSGTDALTQQPASAATSKADAKTAAKASGKTPAKARGGKTGSATAANAQTKGRAKTAKATASADAPKGSTKGGAKAAKVGKATKADAAPKTGAAETAKPAKARKGKAAKATQGSAAPVTRTRTSRKPPLAQAAPGATPNSVAQVKAAAADILRNAGAPVPRRELYNRLIQSGIVISGKDPVENMTTMLYKDPDKQFVNTARSGFQLRDRA